MVNIGTAISIEDFRMDKDIQTETDLGTEMEDLTNHETELGNDADDMTAEIEDVGNELEVAANDTEDLTVEREFSSFTDSAILKARSCIGETL